MILKDLKFLEMPESDGGAAVITREHLECKKVDLSWDDLDIQLTGVRINIILYSVYCRPPWTVLSFSRVEAYLEQIIYPMVITGDFNCHY